MGRSSCPRAVPVIAALAVLVAALETAPAWAGPKWSGEVRPLSTPVTLAYRPYPRSSFTMSNASTTSSEGQTAFDATGTVRGWSEAKEAPDNDLIVTTWIDLFSVHVVGRSPVEVRDINVRTVMTPSGEVLSTSASAAGRPMTQAEVTGLAAQQQSGSIVFSTDPVGVGEVAGSARSAAHAGVVAAERYVVVGETTVNGRTNIVLDVVGTLSVEGATGTISGYALVDKEYGLIARSEKVGEVAFTFDGKPAYSSFHVTTQLDLH